MKDMPGRNGYDPTPTENLRGKREAAALKSLAPQRDLAVFRNTEVLGRSGIVPRLAPENRGVAPAALAPHCRGVAPAALAPIHLDFVSARVSSYINRASGFSRATNLFRRREQTRAYTHLPRAPDLEDSIV